MLSISRTHGRARTLVCAAMLFALALTASGVVLAQAAAAQKSTVDIMLTSKPSPPKTGENTFEVMVKDASGKPITDAEVSAEFFMAKMGNMPEMKNTVALKHQKEGRYAGTGQVMMAGKWDVTVKVKRGGKEIGSKKFPVTAQ
jgi:uncharacterized GH25 family protein